MGYPLTIALRYTGSSKRVFVMIATLLAITGVALGVSALSVAMSVSGGFLEQFRDKILGVNAHVLVLKYSVDFREYRDIIKRVRDVEGVVGVAPFVINPMMVTHNDRTATGVLLKGVDPDLLPTVLDLPRHIVEGSLKGLRVPGAKPPARSPDLFASREPWATEPATPGETGPDAAASADAGSRSLLEAIEKQIAEDEARSAASARPAATAGPIAEAPARDPAAPVGDVRPHGGFASTLPPDDVLPDSIDPDPCKSPSRVAALPGVAVGRTLAKQLNIGLGDCVQITSPTIGTMFGGTARPPIAKQFRVVAVFEAGFDQYDSKLVYTDLYEAQAFYDYGDSVTGVEMKVDDIDHAHRIAEQIDRMLGNAVYHTMDWKELNSSLFAALLIQQIGASIVLGLIIVVAAFTVVATIIMIVLEKKREIALLKALGAKNDAILRLFLYHGGIIGFLGTTLGLVLGYVACRALSAYEFKLDPKVYFISKLPVDLQPAEFAITGIFAVVICLVATIFPALYAARLRPSDGLRAG